MLNKIVTVVSITLLACLIWLFAEAESLGESTIPEVNVSIGSNSADRIVTRSSDWRNRVSVEIRGSRGAIEEARVILGEGVTLTPGMTGVPDGGGTVDLLTAVRNLNDLRATGVEVITVTPIRTEITVTELVNVSAPVRAQLQGVSVTGPVEIDPANITVRLPAALRQQLGEDLAVLCVPEENALNALPDNGAATVNGRITLPPSLRGVEGVAIVGQQTATMRFSVVSTQMTLQLDIVPVQVTVPSIEFNEWRVRLSADNASISASITGPRQIVSGIADENSGTRLVGLLYLRSDELNLGISSKALRFGLVAQDGTLSPIPASVTVVPSTETVRFTIERVPDAQSNAGE
ncbi:MAG: hypothetical protein RLN60_02495 [Phycisphaerales bacterium]